ncbi:hypothetical protein MtrunA17_Chr5g0437381 [Medicago truncatula]|uniref:Uncharacterized protein n=1 Tax=Medicago truncatula TaxID=3880 RepID=A0A396HUY9_MEDTR|nr:hypothetical protein MtrunA17_Chr5g0437381 [Medicago truncatula]
MKVTKTDSYDYYKVRKLVRNIFMNKIVLNKLKGYPKRIKDFIVVMDRWRKCYMVEGDGRNPRRRWWQKRCTCKHPS